MASHQLPSAWNSISYWWTFKEESAHWCTLCPTNPPFGFKLITSGQNDAAATFRTITDDTPLWEKAQTCQPGDRCKECWRTRLEIQRGDLQADYKWSNALMMTLFALLCDELISPGWEVGERTCSCNLLQGIETKEYFQTTSTCCNIYSLKVCHPTQRHVSLVKERGGR